MNSGLSSDHPSVLYYDGDYPSGQLDSHAENFDSTTNFQGIARDVARIQELAKQTDGKVLELCCGTGRVAIPLARSGLEVLGVDVSSGMLSQFQSKLNREPDIVKQRIELIEQDIACLSLEKRDFNFAYIAFNSLLCIPSFEGQLASIQSVAGHMAPGGLFVIDIVNPLKLPIEGTQTPKLFYTRRNPRTGRIFSRFSMAGPFDENQKQELHGWYDELGEDGSVKRQFYSQHWRPIFRFEIELMLNRAGFEIAVIEGGHNKEPWTAQSPHMFIQARKVERGRNVEA